MNEQRNNGRGIFYGVIGVATLVVAIIGATFAYFTATQSDNATITGNMASIGFGLEVKKVTKADETKGGMIPMSNTMVEAAVKGTGDTPKKDTADTQQICVDDNGNAVCQIYKISVSNTGSAGMFLDGYVSLTGGSNQTTSKTPEDTTSEMWKYLTGDSAVKTTMRWAQVFCEGTDNLLTKCSTAGSTTTRATGIDAFTSIGVSGETTETDASTRGFNRDNIKTGAVTGTGVYSSNNYDIINTNYIRISDHTLEASYDRTKDVTSALVFNQRIDPKGTGTPVDATAADSDSTKTYTDSQVYYIVVWLAETGVNQTGSSDNVTTGSTETEKSSKFFNGNVTFVSAQGSEVTATFSSYATVKSDQATR